MQSLQIPLTPEELDELENALAHPDIVERSMDVSMLHGYLTALVIGPQPVMPSTWLPWVWDCDEGKVEPRWATPLEAGHVMQLVLRMQNEIARAFSTDPQSFEPLWETWENAAADNWSRGFLVGVGLHEEAWEPLLEAHPEWLAPAMALAEEEEEGEGDAALDKMSEDELEAYYGELFDQTHDNTIGIHAYFEPYRRAAAGVKTVRREQPKVGRNDPCSCGSGKKFKNCCGAG